MGRGKAPFITVAPIRSQAGIGLRAVGHNWPRGERVVIGLGAPGAQPKDSETITTVLADAGGDFVALFTLPADERWQGMSTLQILAHSRDFARVAVASFDYAQFALPTLTPTEVPSATPSPRVTAYVLGHVVNVVASSGLVKVQPIDGDVETVALLSNTEIEYEGQPAQVTDISIGILIEASGYASDTTGKSMFAERIRILSRATAEPTATPTPTLATLIWKGEYYANTTLSGSPKLVRNDAVIDFSWQGSGPAEGLAADNFAVRWTGSWPFEAGAVRFQAQVDDGVRLWLDGHLIMDQWHESSGALYTADAYLSAGSHFVRVEYFKAQGNGQARLWWEYRGPDATQTYPDWKGEYYGNLSLSPPVFLVVNERVIDFDWGAGAPANGMPSDNFSVRWTRTVYLGEGVYRFYARADDGVRLWVDGKQLIDQWQEGGVRAHLGDMYLVQGNHRLAVEYYERSGLAVSKVWWELLPATPTPTSSSTPMPTLAPTQSPTFTPVPPTPTRLAPIGTPTAVVEPTPLTRQPTPEARAEPASGPPFHSYLPLLGTPLSKRAPATTLVKKRRGGTVESWR